MNEVFGERIRAIRRAKNLTQKDVAEKMGVSYQAYSQYERAKRAPKNETIGRIAQALDVDVFELVDTYTYKSNAYSTPLDFERDSIRLGRAPHSTTEPAREAAVLASMERMNEAGQRASVKILDLIATFPEYQKESET